MKPKNTINIVWSGNLAYAVGLMATDGCLYNDNRHMAFVSKDLQQIKTFKKCLGLENQVSIKPSGFSKTSFAYWVQFGDVRFYQFLVSIGLTPAKSKTMGEIKVPEKYFFDFLRGSFDGDGSFYSYWDKRWASSFLYYLEFISASYKHILWLRQIIEHLVQVRGHVNSSFKAGVYQLKYAKSDARVIFKKMYHNSKIPRLERKYKKVYTALAIDRKNP